MPRTTYIQPVDIRVRPETAKKIKVTTVVLNLTTMSITGLALAWFTFYCLSGGAA